MDWASEFYTDDEHIRTHTNTTAAHANKHKYLIVTLSVNGYT